MNTRAPKILLLTSSYPRSSEDTASIFLRQLAESVGHRGIQVHVLAPADGKGAIKIDGNVIVHRFQYFPASLQRLAYGSGILPNLQRKPWLWIQVPFFLTSMVYSLLWTIRKEKPDLVHAHWILPQGLIAALAKYLCKVPVITTAHGADAFALQGRLTNWLKRLAIATSDAWTTNTLATAEAIGQTSLLPKPRVIPMGVDVELFSGGSPMPLRRELPNDEFLVLFVGRLVEKKGCQDLLEAYSLLTPGLRSKTSLWVVGDGDQRPQLQRYAKAAGIADKVRFWGAIRNDRLPEFYAVAELFVAPSVEAAAGDTEGQGVVLLEAFASRVCVLATRVGGIPEVVTDSITGVLVEPRDPRKLASAIERLLVDEPLRRRLAENAFNEVKSEYGWEKIAAQFEQLYRQVWKA